MMRSFCPFLSLVVCLMVAVPSQAAVSDALDATCRVHASDGSVGTGCVFEISQRTVFVLTNRHVVDSASTVKCVFWRDGHQSIAIPGQVRAKSAAADVALITLPESAFSGQLPRVIPLAPRGTSLKAGDTITSAGCAKAAWATAWKGHVAGYENGHLRFSPPPANGRSGSAICDAKGEKIVGLIWGRSDQEGKGYAVSLENLYRSLRFQQTKTGWIYSPKPLLTQCGPGGCPVLPYRRYEDWKGAQRDERMGRLEDRADRVWPTLPGVGDMLPPPLAGSNDFYKIEQHLQRQDAQLQAIAVAVDAKLKSLESGLADKVVQGIGGSLGSSIFQRLKSLLAKIGVGGAVLVVIVGLFVWGMYRRNAYAVAGGVDKLTDMIPGKWDDMILDTIAYKAAQLVGTDTPKKPVKK